MIIKKTKKKVLLKGISACPGKINGKLFLIKDPNRVQKAKRGAILVVPFATPILSEVIARAKGLITDLGGITCHSANIAREFGIPCIVGTKRATKILKNNQEIILDANQGTVYETR